MTPLTPQPFWNTFGFAIAEVVVVPNKSFEGFVPGCTMEATRMNGIETGFAGAGVGLFIHILAMGHNITGADLGFCCGSALFPGL